MTREGSVATRDENPTLRTHPLHPLPMVKL